MFGNFNAPCHDRSLIDEAGSGRVQTASVWYCVVNIGLVLLGIYSSVVCLVDISIGSAVNRLRISFEALQSQFWLGNIFHKISGSWCQKLEKFNSQCDGRIRTLYFEPVPQRCAFVEAHTTFVEVEEVR